MDLLWVTESEVLSVVLGLANSLLSRVIDKFVIEALEWEINVEDGQRG